MNGSERPGLRRAPDLAGIPIPEAMRGLRFQILEHITIPPKPQRAVDKRFLDDGHQA